MEMVVSFDRFGNLLVANQTRVCFVKLQKERNQYAVLDLFEAVKHPDLLKKYIMQHLSTTPFLSALLLKDSRNALRLCSEPRLAASIAAVAVCSEGSRLVSKQLRVIPNNYSPGWHVIAGDYGYFENDPISRFCVRFYWNGLDMLAAVQDDHSTFGKILTYVLDPSAEKLIPFLAAINSPSEQLNVAKAIHAPSLVIHLLETRSECSDPLFYLSHPSEINYKKLITLLEIEPKLDYICQIPHQHLSDYLKIYKYTNQTTLSPEQALEAGNLLNRLFCSSSFSNLAELLAKDHGIFVDSLEPDYRLYYIRKFPYQLK